MEREVTFSKPRTQMSTIRGKASMFATIHFTGSAGAMEPYGSLALFQRSLGYSLRYKYLISDGDSKTFALLSHEQVYGNDQVDKLDCVGHVQKRLGTALT